MDSIAVILIQIPFLFGNKEMLRNYVLQESIVNDFFVILCPFVLQGCEKEYMLSFISGKKEAPFTFNGKCQEKSKM
jgi:hypothetical protein